MQFPGVKALDDVSIVVNPGEIHALLGENGAGKSTLGKILGGIYEPEAGRIVFDGEEVSGLDEKRAGELGIGIVHQEGSLVPQLSVAENIFTGRQPTKWFGKIDRARMYREAGEILHRLGLDLDVRTPVANLSSAQAQQVEIAKAVSRNLRLLILDEPTAAFTQKETDKLFDLVRQLASKGVATIYVSHRLAEIFELCQQVTILKDGKLVGTREVSRITAAELIAMMVGREVQFQRDTSRPPAGVVRLAAEHVLAGSHVRDASLEVRSGEIVCLAGLVGSGRTEFCEVLFGVRDRQGGTIRLDGRPFAPGGPWDAIDAGVGMVCEDRKSSGLFLQADISSNIAVTCLDQVSMYGKIVPSRLREMGQRYVDSLSIATPSPDQIVGNLSGGNQQKVLLAKWLAMRPQVLIVDEPTRGVDVGARAEIYRILRGLAADGIALIVVSSDLPEVLALADRIVVMADGHTVGTLSGDDATEEAVMRLATAVPETQPPLPDPSGVNHVHHQSARLV